LLLPCFLLAAEDKPAAKFPVGKETTYVTGPLDKEGYIDYLAALNARLGKGIVPEKNANVLLWKAFGPTREDGDETPAEFFKRLGMNEPPRDGAYLIELRTYLKDRLKLDASEFAVIDDQQRRAGQRPWAAKDYPHVAGWLKANEKPLAVAIEATRRPDYFSPLVPPSNKGPGALTAISTPGLQKCRELARALAARAMLRVAKGQFDEAWQDLLACHRLGRLIARAGTIIDGLVGLAIDSIAGTAGLAYVERGKLTSKQIQQGLKDLQGLPPLPPLADSVDPGERLMFLDSLQMIRRGGVGMLEGLAGGEPRKATPEDLKVLAKIDWQPALRAGNRWYDRMAAAMRLKDHADREKAFDRIESDLKALKTNAVSTSNLAKFILGEDPPDKLAGKAIGDILFSLLVPAVRLTAVPNDIFSGAPLVFRPSEKGYLLYSVGANGKDEGGRTWEDDPPGDDLSMGMPLPELKRKK
jgi:hypothetical protein